MYSDSFTARPTGTSNSTSQNWTGHPSSLWPQPVAPQGLSRGLVAAPPCRPPTSFFPPPTSLDTRGFSSRFFLPPEAMASSPPPLPLFPTPCPCEAPTWSPVPGSHPLHHPGGPRKGKKQNTAQLLCGLRANRTVSPPGSPSLQPRTPRHAVHTQAHCTQGLCTGRLLGHISPQRERTGPLPSSSFGCPFKVPP